MALTNSRARLGDVGESRHSPLNLNSLLAAVEAAPPVAAVDVLAGALAEAIGAREVSFLIADFSGRSLIRLGHSGGKGALRLGEERLRSGCRWLGRRTGERCGPSRARRHGGARLFALVTSRGKRSCSGTAWRDFPLERTWLMLWRPLPGVRVIGTAGTPIYSSGDSARFRCRWRRRSSIGCCLVPLRARPGNSHSPPGCSQRVRSVATPSIFRSSETHCICR